MCLSGATFALAARMNPQAEALKARTKKFALDVEFLETIPHRGAAVRMAGRLLDEAGELTAIFAASTITARKRIGKA